MQILWLFLFVGIIQCHDLASNKSTAPGQYSSLGVPNTIEYISSYTLSVQTSYITSVECMLSSNIYIKSGFSEIDSSTNDAISNLIMLFEEGLKGLEEMFSGLQYDLEKEIKTKLNSVLFMTVNYYKKQNLTVEESDLELRHVTDTKSAQSILTAQRCESAYSNFMTEIETLKSKYSSETEYQSSEYASIGDKEWASIVKHYYEARTEIDRKTEVYASIRDAFLYGSGIDLCKGSAQTDQKLLEIYKTQDLSTFFGINNQDASALFTKTIQHMYSVYKTSLTVIYLHSVAYSNKDLALRIMVWEQLNLVRANFEYKSQNLITFIQGVQDKASSEFGKDSDQYQQTMTALYKSVSKMLITIVKSTEVHYQRAWHFDSQDSVIQKNYNSYTIDVLNKYYNSILWKNANIAHFDIRSINKNTSSIPSSNMCIPKNMYSMVINKLVFQTFMSDLNYILVRMRTSMISKTDLSIWIYKQITLKEMEYSVVFAKCTATDNKVFCMNAATYSYVIETSSSSSSSTTKTTSTTTTNTQTTDITQIMDQISIDIIGTLCVHTIDITEAFQKVEVYVNQNSQESTTSLNYQPGFRSLTGQNTVGSSSSGTSTSSASGTSTSSASGTSTSSSSGTPTSSSPPGTYGPPPSGTPSPPSPSTSSPPTPETTSPPSPDNYSQPPSGTPSPTTPETTSPPSPDNFSPPTPETTSPPSPDNYSSPPSGTPSQPTNKTPSQPTPETSSPPSPDNYSPPTPETTNPPSPDNYSPPTPETTSPPSPDNYSSPPSGTPSQPTNETPSQPTPETSSSSTSTSSNPPSPSTSSPPTPETTSSLSGSSTSSLSGSSTSSLSDTSTSSSSGSSTTSLSGTSTSSSEPGTYGPPPSETTSQPTPEISSPPTPETTSSLSGSSTTSLSGSSTSSSEPGTYGPPPSETTSQPTPEISSPPTPETTSSLSGSSTTSLSDTSTTSLSGSSTSSSEPGTYGPPPSETTSQPTPEISSPPTPETTSSLSGSSTTSLSDTSTTSLSGSSTTSLSDTSTTSLSDTSTSSLSGSSTTSLSGTSTSSSPPGTYGPPPSETTSQPMNETPSQSTQNTSGSSISTTSSSPSPDNYSPQPSGTPNTHPGSPSVTSSSTRSTFISISSSTQILESIDYFSSSVTSAFSSSTSLVQSAQQTEYTKVVATSLTSCQEQFQYNIAYLNSIVSKSEEYLSQYSTSDSNDFTSALTALYKDTEEKTAILNSFLEIPLRRVNDYSLNSNEYLYVHQTITYTEYVKQFYNFFQVDYTSVQNSNNDVNAYITNSVSKFLEIHEKVTSAVKATQDESYKEFLLWQLQETVTVFQQTTNSLTTYISQSQSFISQTSTSSQSAFYKEITQRMETICAVYSGVLIKSYQYAQSSTSVSIYESEFDVVVSQTTILSEYNEDSSTESATLVIQTSQTTTQETEGTVTSQASVSAQESEGTLEISADVNQVSQTTVVGMEVSST